MVTDSALSMKLLIDRKAQRVLFAEVSKEVVDFLFFLLVLPVATAVKLVGKDDLVGCFGNLYTSVEKLDSAHVRPGADKNELLCPAVSSPAAGTATSSSLLRLRPPAPPPKAFFKCPYNLFHDHNSYVTDERGTICPSCGARMTTVLKYVSPPSGVSGQQAKDVPAGGAKGFVQGNATYTVMDNLSISPMSSISSITLLNTFAVRDIGDLQEKIVPLGHDEGLAILKASLQSKTVLTDVFLGKKQAPRPACINHNFARG